MLKTGRRRQNINTHSGTVEVVNATDVLLALEEDGAKVRFGGLVLFDFFSPFFLFSFIFF